MQAVQNAHMDGTQHRIGDLFVAGRGSAVTDGLHHFAERDAGWEATQVASVDQLAALCRHPSLPVVYGLSGLGRGLLHAWNVTAVPSGPAVTLAEKDCLGEIPCDLAVSQDGRMLVAANFGTDVPPGSGSLAVWALAADGTPLGDGKVIALTGASFATPVKQEVPHPHQVVFNGSLLYVPDFGADLVRRFTVDAAAATLTEIAGLPVPPGTAPRHMVITDDAQLALVGELASTLLRGPVDGSAWAAAPSTTRTGPAKTRHARNYPGDLKLSPDGRTVYLANRGYDTIAVFAIDRAAPRLVVEVDVPAAWPQHLLVTHAGLVVAGWDSSAVALVPFDRGRPGTPTVLFECVGAGWLLPATRVGAIARRASGPHRVSM